MIEICAQKFAVKTLRDLGIEITMASSKTFSALIFLTVAGGALFGMPSKCLAPPERGWLLSQVHPANGKQRVYVFPHHLRVENLDLAYTLVADADSGKVWVFSDQRRKICCVKWDRFEHSFTNMLNMGGENLSRLTWFPVPRKTPPILGLETKVFEAKGDKFSLKGSGTNGVGGFISGKGRTENVDFTVYTAAKILTSPKLLKVLCQQDTVPVLGGVPLRQTSYYSSRTKTRVRFDTSAAKEIAEEKKFWEIPKYKAVATVTDVTSQTDKAFIKDLLGE